MVEMNTVFKKSDRVVSRKIVDELILVPIRTSVADMESLYTLNDVGARVYELIDGQRTIAQICDAIVDEFEVTKEQAHTDVSTFTEQLMEIGAIEK